jgi:hypothetical protein
MHIDDVKIDDEFHKLCPALSSEELNRLRENILNDGAFLDPIIVWESEKLLMDGHNRMDVWWNLLPDQQKKIAPPEIKLVEFKSRAAAHNWIINKQLGRRNLDAKQKAYLVGKWYQEEKKNKTENLNKGKKPSDSPKRHNDASGKTSESIGQKIGQSPRQVERDASFTEAVDTLVENVGPEVKDEILTGKEISKNKVMEIAQLPAAKQKAEFDRAMGRGEPAGGMNFNPEEWGGMEPAENPVVPADVVTKHHIKEMQAPWREVQKLKIQLKNAIEKLPESPAGPWCGPNAMQDIWSCFNNLFSTINHRKPVEVCGHCGGKKCDKCYQTGALNKDLADTLKEGQAAAN